MLRVSHCTNLRRTSNASSYYCPACKELYVPPVNESPSSPSLPLLIKPRAELLQWMGPLWIKPSSFLSFQGFRLATVLQRVLWCYWWWWHRKFASCVLVRQVLDCSFKWNPSLLLLVLNVIVIDDRWNPLILAPFLNSRSLSRFTVMSSKIRIHAIHTNSKYHCYLQFFFWI